MAARERIDALPDVLDDGDAVPGEEVDQPEAALLEGTAGHEGVAGAAQPVRARLIALLERAHRLLLQRLHLVQRAAARAVRRRLQRRVSRAHDLVYHLA